MRLRMDVPMWLLSVSAIICAASTCAVAADSAGPRIPRDKLAAAEKPTVEVLTVSPLKGVCMATPAIADGTLLFRTRSKLIAIGAK